MEDLEEEVVEIDLREYFNIILRHKLILIILVVIAIVGSFFITSQLTRIYQTSTLLMVKQDKGVDNLFSQKLPIADLGNQIDKVATYIQILPTRSILQKVINELNLTSPKTDKLITPEKLKRKINISRKGETNLITVTVNYSDPRMAKKIANTLVEKFRVENRKINQTQLEGAGQFITSQLKQVKSKLKGMEDKLLQYKEDKNVVLPEKQGEMILERLTELQTAQAKAEINLKQSKASLKEVKKQLTSQNKRVVSAKTITDNPLVQQYRSELSKLEVKLAGLKESYKDAHPKVIEIKTRIKKLKQKLHKAVKEVVSSKTKTINPLYSELNQKLSTLQTKAIVLKSQLKNYQQQIEKVNNKLTTIPEKELKLARLKRERKVTKTVYTMLRERKEEVQIQKAMKTSNIVVIDPAIVREDPIKPNVKLNIVIAVILALFTGLGIIFLIEYLDTTVKTEREVNQITNLPVLGVIPDIESIDHDQGYGRGGK
ncbi:GumC family protein [Sporohalobacter salinus]|uniref:GumC family protein n=1 Tax=Sporohalobacter salinus TaxID=1494606 RepID=UPI00195F50FE|nr:GNVR domain-containing protein [Sporohalobacter salinus]MBM7622987.1 polysaccharide chain length determinant protein (PEP-CTERM system associated) [Sporohalobacter salinus]